MNYGTKRIPTLDGWRGIAILIVIFAHAQFGLSRTPPFGGHLEWTRVGPHGVAIFFVLSGYLITTRLLQSDRIDLKRFYTRRFFRLMPCVWTYLLILSGIAAITGVGFIHSLWSCLFFYRNSVGASRNYDQLTEHFWSLSIEEQFYLMWPAVLVFSGRGRALIVSAVGFVALSIFVCLNWRAYEGPLSYRTEMNAHALLAGCVLALLFQHSSVRGWVARWSGWLLAFAVPAMLFQIVHPMPVIFPTESICIAVVLAATSAAPLGPLSRILEWKPLAFLGTISYSVYVWQQVLLIPVIGWLGVMLLPAIAVGSWALIEQPGIRLGGWCLKRLDSRQREQAVMIEP
jgi:peptidoglycan/LPS O-acetylase OafA/YrhL